MSLRIRFYQKNSVDVVKTVSYNNLFESNTSMVTVIYDSVENIKT